MQDQQSSGDRNHVLVCFAVREEAAAFRKLTSGRAGLQILLTGIGQQNVARSICAALDGRRPDLLISAGFAGALDSQLKFGAVVFSTGVRELCSKLEKAGARPVKFFCADHIAVTGVEKQQLRETTGADAVEMESGTIQDICRERGIRSAVVRIILDEAGEDLPLDFNGCLTAGKEISLWKLMRAVAGRPAAIPGLIRMQRQSALAARTLADYLVRIV